MRFENPEIALFVGIANTPFDFADCLSKNGNHLDFHWVSSEEVFIDGVPAEMKRMSFTDQTSGGKDTRVIVARAVRGELTYILYVWYWGNDFVKPDETMVRATTTFRWLP